MGIKPWVGVFLNNIDETEAADLAALSQAGSATIGIHAFTDPISFYYNQYNGDYPDAVMAANYVTGTQWFASHNITPSTYVVPHHYEIGSNAFGGLTDWGVHFIATHLNRPAGSLGRSQACSIALRFWGDSTITDAVLTEWLDRLMARNEWLSFGRKRPIPHESWFQVAGYFYYYIDDARIVIPRVYWDFSRGKVLTLEFVGGIKISECAVIKASGMDCRTLVNLLAEAYAKMIFVHGLFHGDPHPGNIFVGEGPTLVFVDFGMVQAISDSTKRNLRRYAHAVVENDTAGIIESLEKMGFLIEGADYKAIADVTQDLIDKYRYSTPEELKALTVDDIGDEINNIRSVINNFQVPNYFMLLGRTIGMLNGMAYRLNPEVNIIEIGKPYIKEFFRGSKEERVDQVFDTIRKKVRLNILS